VDEIEPILECADRDTKGLKADLEKLVQYARTEDSETGPVFKDILREVEVNLPTVPAGL
jgi:hypothetical protein